jgi:hypothetical protein
MYTIWLKILDSSRLLENGGLDQFPGGEQLEGSAEPARHAAHCRIHLRLDSSELVLAGRAHQDRVDQKRNVRLEAVLRVVQLWQHRSEFGGDFPAKQPAKR